MEQENAQKGSDRDPKPGAEKNGGARGADQAGAGAKELPNLDFILDIPLEVSVELGRSKVLISELLQLGQGSVIELNKLAGEPLEIFVNQKLIARGEVVVVNEKFGIKMTDIVSPMERIKQLGT
jgi:flagellar motor switch protein FliN/FliY